MKEIKNIDHLFKELDGHFNLDTPKEGHENAFFR